MGAFFKTLSQEGKKRIWQTTPRLVKLQLRRDAGQLYLTAHSSSHDYAWFKKGQEYKSTPRTAGGSGVREVSTETSLGPSGEWWLMLAFLFIWPLGWLQMGKSGMWHHILGRGPACINAESGRCPLAGDSAGVQGRAWCTQGIGPRYSLELFCEGLWM